MKQCIKSPRTIPVKPKPPRTEDILQESLTLNVVVVFLVPVSEKTWHVYVPSSDLLTLEKDSSAFEM